MTLLSLQVNASANDAYQLSGTCNITSTSLVIAGTASYGGFRFTNVTVDNAATITSATLSIYLANSAYDTPNGLTVYGEDTDDAAAFAATSNNLSTRTATTATTTWPGANLGTGWHTIDVTTIVQEIVNRAGWASGNDMALLIQGASGSDVRPRSYDGDTAYAAKLDIDWTAAAAASAHRKIGRVRLATKVGGALA